MHWAAVSAMMNKIPTKCHCAPNTMFISGPHSPRLDLLGSYFLAWMLCAIVGILAVVVIRRVLVVAGIDEYVLAPC